MQIMEEIVDDLARRTLKAAIEKDDDTLIQKVADAIANASPTMEEAFLTAVRIRRGEMRAIEVLVRFEDG